MKRRQRKPPARAAAKATRRYIARFKFDDDSTGDLPYERVLRAEIKQRMCYAVLQAEQGDHALLDRLAADLAQAKLKEVRSRIEGGMARRGDGEAAVGLVRRRMKEAEDAGRTFKDREERVRYLLDKDRPGGQLVNGSKSSVRIWLTKAGY